MSEAAAAGGAHLEEHDELLDVRPKAPAHGQALLLRQIADDLRQTRGGGHTGHTRCA